MVETYQGHSHWLPRLTFASQLHHLSSGSLLTFVADPSAPFCSTTTLNSFNFLISSSSASKYFVTVWIRVRQPVSFSFNSMCNSVHSSWRNASLRWQIGPLSSICTSSICSVSLAFSFFPSCRGHQMLRCLPSPLTLFSDWIESIQQQFTTLHNNGIFHIPPCSRVSAPDFYILHVTYMYIHISQST